MARVNQGTTNTILTVGTYIFCECGSIIAGTNQQLGTSGSTYVVCAGTPYPTVSTIVNVPTTAKTPTTITAPAKPKPSQAIIIYREDSCDDLGCSSSAHVWAIYPGQVIDPCKNGTTDFLYHFPQSEANENSDYAVDMGPWTSYDKKIEYSGTNLHVGTLTGDGLPGSPIQCIVPAVDAESCTSSHSIQADDQTPIAYCEW